LKIFHVYILHSMVLPIRLSMYLYFISIYILRLFVVVGIKTFPT